MPEINLLIVDIDNTLFDWFNYWHSSFTAMIDAVLDRTGIDRDALLGEIRQIHRRHGTTEYSWLLQDVPSVSRLPKDAQQEVIDAGRAAFSEARERTSHLYADVDSTLHAVKSSGARIVGFTESQSFYTIQRLLRFGLDGILDALYCREEHLKPPEIQLTQMRSRPPESYALKKTIVVELKTHNRKPDPQILLRIARDFQAEPDKVLYVGDSKMKDIYMAQQAGVRDAFAEYGQSMDKEGYDLLRAVSSWTDEEIAKEKAMAVQVKPTVVLKNFSDLLQYFTFSGRVQSQAKRSSQ